MSEADRGSQPSDVTTAFLCFLRDRFDGRDPLAAPESPLRTREPTATPAVAATLSDSTPQIAIACPAGAIWPSGQPSDLFGDLQGDRPGRDLSRLAAQLPTGVRLPSPVTVAVRIFLADGCFDAEGRPHDPNGGRVFRFRRVDGGWLYTRRRTV